MANAWKGIAGCILMLLMSAGPAAALWGNEAITTVPGGQVVRLGPGHYGRVIVQPRGILELQGYRRRATRPGQGQPDPSPVYQFQSIELMPAVHGGRALLRFSSPPPDTLASDWAVGTAVTVLERLVAGAESVIRPAGQGQHGSSFAFEVIGVNVSDVAFAMGPRSLVNASVFAPLRAISFGPRARAFGRFVGRTITVGTETEFGLD